MSNRVLINTQHMKVSRPSVDVLTAADSDLYFSSEWAGVGLLTRGSFVIYNTTQVIYFGKTFATPPSFRLWYSNASTALTSFTYSWVDFTPAGSSDSIRVYSNRIEITGNPDQGSTTWAYIIWDQIA